MRLLKTQIITLANQKGGCGKTTTSVSLAAGLALEGYSVTIVDDDPQCNSTDSFSIDRDALLEEGHYSLADAYLGKKAAREIEYSPPDSSFGDKLSVVPGHRGLNTVHHRLEAQLNATVADENYSDLDADDIKNEHRSRLKQSLDSLRGHRDFVIIDTPPELGFLLTSALIASDWYIVPVFPGGYDLKGLETLWRNVEKVRSRFNPDLKLLGVLLGKFDARTKLDSDIRKMLIKKVGSDFFETLIHDSVKHREATVYSKTIYEHADASQGAEQFHALTKEVINRIEKALASELNGGGAKEVSNG